MVYEPYFLIACKVSRVRSPTRCVSPVPTCTSSRLQKGMESQVEEWLLKKYEDQIVKLERERKEDLKLVRCPRYTRLTAKASPWGSKLT